MTFAIRAGETIEDVRAAITPIWHYFGVTPSDDTVRDFAELMTPERVLAAFDGDAAIGGCGSFPFRLTVPGGHVRAAGLTMVGVRPTHRRRGILSSLVDVAKALNARTYGPDEIVIEVEDSLCPYNAGRWLIGPNGVTRTERSADLRCNIDALACAYLGGFSWRQLVASSRALAQSDDAVSRADRVFVSHGAPWCPEIF